MISENSNSSKLPLRGFLVSFAAIAILLLGLSWLLFDEPLTDWVDSWISAETLNRKVYTATAVLILASDLLLPVPSSAVITHAGTLLGILGGTVVGFLGLTLGSLIGFTLAHWLGRRFVNQRVSPQDLEQLQSLTERFGAFTIVLLRPVPIFAEASVLLLGLGGMTWRSFLIWLSISNLCVALLFAGLGTWARQQGFSESVTILISIAIPLILLILVKFTFPTLTTPNTTKESLTDDNPEQPL